MYFYSNTLTSVSFYSNAEPGRKDPGPGIKPLSPVLQGGLSTTGPPGKFLKMIFLKYLKKKIKTYVSPGPEDNSTLPYFRFFLKKKSVFKMFIQIQIKNAVKIK